MGHGPYLMPVTFSVGHLSEQTQGALKMYENILVYLWK